jgi:hypothetical protein
MIRASGGLSSAANERASVLRGFGRFLLITGLLTGFFGGLALATLVDWVDHPRLRAHVTVQPNGGAQERFVIRLPRDRILDSGSPGGLPAVFPETLKLPDGLLPGGHAEQFKLRDREGEVIGVAARHTELLGGRATAAWVLYLPGRGSVLLEHQESAEGLTGELARRNLVAGRAWEGELTVRRTAGPLADGLGRVVGGSREFSRLGGSYTETWRLTGVDADGGLRGTIEIDTVTVLTP